MFWRRKSEAFDWHKHVRTTIKLRREARRQKIDGAVDLAVGGLKDAGRAGASAGAAGLDAVNRAFATPFVLAGRAVAAVMSGIAGVAGRGLAPVGQLMERRGLAPMLGLAAAIGGLLGLARSSVAGWDAISLILTLGAAAIFLALVVPPFLTGRGPAGLASAARRLQEAAARLPGAARVPVNAQRGGMAIAVLALTASLAWLGGKAILQLPRGSLAAIPGLSRPVVEGTAVALGADTLRIGNQIVRLDGIVAPEPEQTCGDGTARERRWKCGEAARAAAREAVRGKTLRCELAGTDERGLRLATCRAGEADIAADLVTRGAVFSQAGLFSSYGRLEQDARNGRRGLFKGTSERPEEYRARHWELAKKKAPQGCPIKGQIRRNERVYVLPWSNQYRAVRVRQDKGERWFCSEAEAQAAGWRPSGPRREARAS